MNNAGLNDLLKWSIEHSEAAAQQASTTSSDAPRSTLNPEALAALLGGPSDADLMREAMTAIVSTENDLQNKLTAFDNFEMLIENLDNANNMWNLGLWEPLLKQLENDEAELRRYACWCLGTAVQNNIKAQERLLDQGAIPTLVKLATEDSSEPVRKKAINALSSGVRNFQPALDVAVESLPEQHKINGKLDAADMESVDTMINKLRENSAKLG